MTLRERNGSKAADEVVVDNIHIKTGFSVFRTHASCLQTLIKVNNETLNVYTVVIFGIVPLLVLLANAAATPAFYTTASLHPGVFVAGVCLALVNCLATITYHLFCQIPMWYHFWSAVDLFGIAVALIAYALGLIAVDYPYPFLPRPAHHAAMILTAVCLVMGMAVARYRVHIARESPVALLVANVGVGIFVTLPAFVSLRGGSSRRAA
ncbi:uncharacterized protein AMSG_05363 [Thecamonas trahens ATCC 50062]|uniref:Uncharacterized protein n=1 Tax=Thecamonas trahens ATCC 50062 TaxID=461836 RepID=A0A0L0DAV1_THETB|nr:hypothetical protein AMSG_05363 [Thecamonas trahens ATCC 50062]KNC49365.1 hypothetical protein AMSG_05363 [Thecamonas trahens ATCC 50062]|eukprot:XP_013757790.1 hypothetical protein AMSG_05363 [Thecamonas trahens ATCC 50062]